MKVEDVLELLDQHSEISESYVLVREINMMLDVGHDHFSPFLKVKIYRGNAVRGYPFHFEVGHNVHTPEQMSPYFPSRTFAETEQEAIRQAISTTTSFLKMAIQNGHEPTDNWLIPNADF